VAPATAVASPPMKSVAALAALAALACGSDGGSDPKAPPAPRTALTAVDAGAPPVDAGITELPGHDPTGAFALDPDPVPRPSGRVRDRDRAGVQLLLRSTPPGAVVLADGVRVGSTPVLWLGEPGAAHEFTFGLPGHAVARYKFIVVSAGVVHARLNRVTSDPVLPPELPVGSPPPERPRPAPVPPPPVDAAPPPPIDAAPPVELDAAAPMVPPIGPSP
jgi:hypothetical protein